MNNSTTNVTLFALFINDVLNYYKDNSLLRPKLEEMVKGHDLSDPFNQVPIDVYNDMCDWVEEKVGKFNVIKLGTDIGETVWSALVGNKAISEDASPIEIIRGLKDAADNMIQDPEGRGWVILEDSDNSIKMKRTQTFNSKLQLGLLKGLVSKSPGTKGVKVDYLESVENGDEFDIYEIKFRRELTTA